MEQTYLANPGKVEANSILALVRHAISNNPQ